MLTDDQIARFHANGYLVVDGLIDKASVLDPLIAEYEARLAQLRQSWIDEGQLDPTSPSGSFQDDIVAAYRAGVDYFQPLDISLPGGAIAADTPFHAGPAAFGLLTAPALLDAVEDLIGPEITSNPIQHVRIKPPSNTLWRSEVRAHITATDWHQDRAVTLEEADATRMVTTWIAVTDATEENGCLQVIPGSHRGEMLPHCENVQVGIPERLLAGLRARPLPVRAGGVIIFHPLTVHGSRPNRSTGVRWSFDLRYHVTGDPSGRPFFPEFIARSRKAPDTVLTDPHAWRALWEAARARLATDGAVKLHRWSPDAAHCA